MMYRSDRSYAYKGLGTGWWKYTCAPASSKSACKSKMVMSLMMIGLAVFTVALLCYDPVAGNRNSLFDERGWARAGQFLTEHMDWSKAPCEDFYEHVCGKYGSEDADGKFRLAMGDQRQAVWKHMRELVEKMDDGSSSGGAGIGKIEELIHRFYHQCVSLYSDGENLLQNFLDASNATVKELLSIGGGSAAGPGEGENKTRETHRWQVLGRFIRNFVGMARILDQDPTKKNPSVKLQFKPTTRNGTLRIELAAASPVMPKPADFDASEPISFEQLASLVPTIQWRHYFDNVFSAGTTAAWLANPYSAVFHVPNPEALNETGRIINDMDNEQFDGVVSETVREILAMDLPMSRRIEDIKRICSSNVIQRQTPAIVLLYLCSIGSSPSEWRHDILNMQRNVFSAFQFLLNSVDWLDERDKEKVHSKLDEVSFFPGIPDWADDEEEVIESMKEFTYDNQSNPFEAEISWLISDKSRSLDQLLTQPEGPENIMLIVNAHNVIEFNKVVMSLGLMLPPFYDIRYPMAVKYGGVGAVIGHELIHSFAPSGLVIPSMLQEQDWLSEHAWKEFEKQKACLAKEYSKYCHPDKAFCISGSGKKSIGENMADVEGLKIAYTAFKFAKQVHGEDPAIPSMLNYTDDQIFFMAHARKWCVRGWDPGWRGAAHSPQKARVDVTVANNPTFARSFQCKVGSKYAPLNRCSVWGDLANPAALRYLGKIENLRKIAGDGL